MKIYISLMKYYPDKDTLKAIEDKSNYLIASDSYWLSKDVIFIRNDVTETSLIQEVDRLNKRVNIAESQDGLSVEVYIVYTDSSCPFLVGVLSDKIIFEIPISCDEKYLEKARQNGFEVTRHGDDEHDPYYPADIISKTYHNGDSRYAGRSDISYDKVIGKNKYRLFVSIDDGQGAEV